MQCPICKNETVNYVEVSDIVPVLHDPLFDLCSYWLTAQEFVGPVLMCWT